MGSVFRRGRVWWLKYKDAAGEWTLPNVPVDPGLHRRVDHLGFQCGSREEVDRIAAEAARLGILAHPAWDGGGDLGYMATVRDPDGHLVEFTFGQPFAGLAG